jgi:hypothetical protein
MQINNLMFYTSPLPGGPENYVLCMREDGSTYWNYTSISRKDRLKLLL